MVVMESFTILTYAIRTMLGITSNVDCWKASRIISEHK